jgi:hypothetical protein
MYNRIACGAALALAIGSGLVSAADKMKPFVLAAKSGGELAGKVAEVRSSLTAAGFEVVGEYTPYSGTTVLGVTNGALKQAAAASQFGLYGAVQRVGVSDQGGELQVTWTNPVYMAAAYRMDSDLAPVRKALASALGAASDYGCEKECMTADELNDYHYTFGMPYFDDPDLLAEHDSQAAAIAAVEKGLSKGAKGVTKVYRVDLPGSAGTVFGVAMNGAKGSGKYQDDRFIMEQIDFKPLRSVAHLPYEMVVVDGKVYALSAKFRIAINFPDLSMMGDNSFMAIMESPDAIRKALTAVAGGKGSVWD